MKRSELFKALEAAGYFIHAADIYVDKRKLIEKDIRIREINVYENEGHSLIERILVIGFANYTPHDTLVSQLKNGEEISPSIPYKAVKLVVEKKLPKYDNASLIGSFYIVGDEIYVEKDFPLPPDLEDILKETNYKKLPCNEIFGKITGVSPPPKKSKLNDFIDEYVKRRREEFERKLEQEKEELERYSN